MTLIRPPTAQSAGRYYPQHKDPRLNEDLRLAYDMMYDMRDHVELLRKQVTEAHQKASAAHRRVDDVAKRPEPGGPSNTKIAGLNVEGIPPANGTAVTNLSGVPVLVYDKATGQITWKIPA